MPFGKWENFNACLTDEDMMKQYPDEETRQKVCGSLQAKAEKEMSRELVFQLSSDKHHQEFNGGLLIKDVKLLASGTWTDSRMGTPLFYSEKVLEKYAGNWIDNSLWSRHSGGSYRSITDKIGEVRNQRYNNGAVVGDLWLHEKTQASRDIVELIKAKLVNYVSVEHGGKERWNTAEKRYDAEEIIFSGVAVVNRGACFECTITDMESLDTEMRMLAAGCRDPDLPASAYAWVEDPEKKTTWHLPYKGMDGEVKCECVRAAIAAIGGARTGKPMSVPDSAKAKLRSAAKTCGIETEFSKINNKGDKNMENESAVNKGTEKEAELRALQAQILESKKSDITALEAQLEEAKKNTARNLAAELFGANQKIAELEQANKEFVRKLAEMEHGSRVKELQKQIAELSKQPVYHTKITTNEHGVTSRELELDNDEFPAYTARDFGE